MTYTAASTSYQHRAFPQTIQNQLENLSTFDNQTYENMSPRLNHVSTKKL